MSVHTIVTRGYASTDNYKIPTLGYASGAVVAETGDPDQTFHARPRGEVFHGRPRGEVFHGKGR